MTVLICRMDARNKTCISALETAKKEENVERKREEKNDFVIKRGGKVISNFPLFGRKSRFPNKQ